MASDQVLCELGSTGHNGSNGVRFPESPPFFMPLTRCYAFGTVPVVTVWSRISEDLRSDKRGGGLVIAWHDVGIDAQRHAHVSVSESR